MPTKTLLDFFTEAQKAKDLTLREVSDALGLNYARIRSWLERGRIPKEYIDALAKVVGLTREQLLEAGAELADGRYARKPNHENVLPIVKVIASSATDLTTSELLAIIRSVVSMRKEGLTVDDKMITTIVKGQ